MTINVSVNSWLDYAVIALITFGTVMLGHATWTAVLMRHDDFRAERPARWGIRGLTPVAAVAAGLVACGVAAGWATPEVAA